MAHEGWCKKADFIVVAAHIGYGHRIAARIWNQLGFRREVSLEVLKLALRQSGLSEKPRKLLSAVVQELE